MSDLEQEPDFSALGERFRILDRTLYESKAAEFRVQYSDRLVRVGGLHQGEGYAYWSCQGTGGEGSVATFDGHSRVLLQQIRGDGSRRLLGGGMTLYKPYLRIIKNEFFLADSESEHPMGIVATDVLIDPANEVSLALTFCSIDREGEPVIDDEHIPEQEFMPALIGTSHSEEGKINVGAVDFILRNDMFPYILAGKRHVVTWADTSLDNMTCALDRAQSIIDGVAGQVPDHVSMPKAA